MPPDSAEHDRAEAVLLDVVAQAEHEGVPELLAVVGELGDVAARRASRRSARRASSVDPAHVGERCGIARRPPASTSTTSRCSRELRRAGEDRARAVDDDAVAVEDEVVLPADDVDVGDDRVGLGGAAGHERQPHLVLVALEGRGVDDEQQPGVRVEHAADRAAVAPEVLADDERDIDALEAQHEQLVAGDEDAVLVEDRVVGQVVLRVARHRPAPRCSTLAQFWAIAVGALRVPSSRGSNGPSGWPTTTTRSPRPSSAQPRGERGDRGVRRRAGSWAARRGPRSGSR